MIAAPERLESGELGETCHVSVLLEESIEALAIQPHGTYVDCTLGGAGHTTAILAHPAKPVVLAFDRDERAVLRAKKKLQAESRLSIFHARFSEIGNIVGENKCLGILADLGISSDQLEEERGFSFHDDSVLDMRMDQSRGITASELLEQCSEQELSRILSIGGVRNVAMRYARAIKKALPIKTPAELAKCVLEATPAAIRYGKDRHPATVVFQAIRIAVNDELAEIKSLLESLPSMAAPGCRIACISFHSGEDKLVAERFRAWSSIDTTPASWRGPRPTVAKALGKMVHKSPVVPSEDEIARNPRARSARLRVFEFFGEQTCLSQ